MAGPYTRILANHGGIARTSEFYAGGMTRELLRIPWMYGKIRHIRHGWWASWDVPEPAIAARTVGGRLACVSALAHHGLVPEPPELHVEVKGHSSRLREIPGRRVVVHWARRPVGGDRQAVNAATAYKQAATCSIPNLSAPTSWWA